MVGDPDAIGGFFDQSHSAPLEFNGASLFSCDRVLGRWVRTGCVSPVGGGGFGFIAIVEESKTVGNRILGYKGCLENLAVFAFRDGVNSLLVGPKNYRKLKRANSYPFSEPHHRPCSQEWCFSDDI
jgi:hypothetical protein